MGSVRVATAKAKARTEVTRHPERGVYDREAIHRILDEALICHVGFAHEGHPFVIPTIQRAPATRSTSTPDPPPYVAGCGPPGS